MIFGGLQKNSLIDYPGKLSCVLFISGCNFYCPYCHNPDLVKGTPTAPLSEKSFFDFIQKRKGFLDAVVISGGEPTLYKELFPLCRKIKQAGYPVKLDTNGSRPEIIETLIGENLIDCIAMDIKTEPTRYPTWIQTNCNPATILSSIRIIMESGMDHEFRTTCIKPLVDEQVIESVSRLIKGAMRYALQKFRNLSEVLRPEFFLENAFLIDDDELLYLKSIAESWVEKCIVR
ncbi:MAG TPA: anaerobic ribonucleoside-triphosphate reductase activating protein [Desulfobacterales bacterium]|nr:anaerobic ribonucleoside-triphosphate reductase activating protein [Desulfobacterales bacterium]